MFLIHDATKKQNEAFKLFKSRMSRRRLAKGSQVKAHEGLDLLPLSLDLGTESFRLLRSLISVAKMTSLAYDSYKEKGKKENGKRKNVPLSLELSNFNLCGIHPADNLTHLGFGIAESPLELADLLLELLGAAGLSKGSAAVETRAPESEHGREWGAG